MYKKMILVVLCSIARSSFAELFCSGDEESLFLVQGKSSVVLCLKTHLTEDPALAHVKLRALIKENDKIEKYRMLSHFTKNGHKLKLPEDGMQLVLENCENKPGDKEPMRFRIDENLNTELRIGAKSWEKSGDELQREFEAIKDETIKLVLPYIIEKARKASN